MTDEENKADEPERCPSCGAAIIDGACHCGKAGAMREPTDAADAVRASAPDNPTDDELRRMVRMDPGDSFIMHLPDGTQRMTGYTAEGGRDESEYAARLRSIYNNWKKGDN